jgi:hypothetical protein
MQHFKSLLTRQLRRPSSLNQPCSEPVVDKMTNSLFDIETRWHRLHSRRYFNALFAFAGENIASDVSGSGFEGTSTPATSRSPVQSPLLSGAGDAVKCLPDYLTEQLHSLSSIIHLDFVRILFAVLDVIIVYRRWILLLTNSDCTGSRTVRRQDTYNHVVPAVAPTPGGDESHDIGDGDATYSPNGLKKDDARHKQNGVGSRPNGTSSSGGMAWNWRADEEIAESGNGKAPPSRNRWSFSAGFRSKCFKSRERCHLKSDSTTGSTTFQRTSIYGRLLPRLYLCLTVFVELYVIVQSVDYSLYCFVRHCCHPVADNVMESLIRLERNAEQVSLLHVSDSLLDFCF